VRDRAKNVLSVLGLKAKQKPNIFGGGADPDGLGERIRPPV
jgi:hypothetical protein